MFGCCLVEQSFHMCLQEGSVDCISFTEVSLELSSQLLLLVSLLTSVFGVLSVFESILSGVCSSVSSVGAVFLILLLVVTAFTIFITTFFVPFCFFWCFLRSSTSRDRQSVALFFAPEIHSNVILYEANSSPHLLIFMFLFFPFRNCARACGCFLL